MSSLEVGYAFARCPLVASRGPRGRLRERMRVRCDRCSTVYEWQDDGAEWAKDCPVCGQLAAWLTPTVRREPKPEPRSESPSPNPFAVTAPVRADAANLPINCPPASPAADMAV